METPNQWEVVASLGTRSREAFLQSADIPTLQDTLPGDRRAGTWPWGVGGAMLPLAFTDSQHPPFPAAVRTSERAPYAASALPPGDGAEPA